MSHGVYGAESLNDMSLLPTPLEIRIRIQQSEVKFCWPWHESSHSRSASKAIYRQ